MPYPKFGLVNSFIVLATLSLALFGWLGWQMPTTLQVGLFVGIMIIFGIPHGAIDHLIYFQSTQKPFSQRNFAFFILYYLSLIAIYTLFWILLPGFSLALFILFSCYHFGQSQLYYLPLSESHPLKIALYLSWGALIVWSMLLFNFQESSQVVAAIFSGATLEQFFTLAIRQGIFIAFLMLTCLLMLFLLIKKRMSRSAFLLELFFIGILLALFYRSSLLISFAIYFGLWHSLKTIFVEMQVLSQDQKPWQLSTFYKEAFPFSFISFIGIALLIGVAQWIQAIISPYLLFFIAISTLTLPHMIIMHRIYPTKKV